MAQRNSFQAPPMTTADHDQHWTHLHAAPHLHLGNGSFVHHTDGSSNSAAPRPLSYPSSSHSNYIALNSVPLYNSYPHGGSTASSSQFPPHQVLYVPPPCINHHGMVNPQTEIGRASSKRKASAMHLAVNGGNPSGYYCGGSSSTLYPLHPQPVAVPQYWPLHSANIPPCYRGDTHLVAGEASQRNVRGRQNHTVNLELNPTVAQSSSNPHGYFRAAGNSLGPNMVAQVNSPMPLTPQPRILSSGPTFNHETNQFLAGPIPNFINTNVRTNMVSHPALPTYHDPLLQGPGVRNSGYIQRSNVHRPSSSCPAVGFAALEGGARSAGAESASSRYSRPQPTIGRNHYRSGRTRHSHSRFHSVYDADSPHSRWYSEGAGLLERSAFYDSRNLFDQHGDMRLDIDNMTYEELLALGERIGKVNTGLSEEQTSECLQVLTHCSSDQSEDDGEGDCRICLEEYKDQDKLGRLRCKHDFHVSCIKNWLLIKNACPICKAAALGDTKEKQL